MSMPVPTKELNTPTTFTEVAAEQTTNSELWAVRNWEENPEAEATIHGQRNSTEIANRAMNTFNCLSLADNVIYALYIRLPAQAAAVIRGVPPWIRPMPL